MNNDLLFSKFSMILKDSEILMRELEEERDEALADLKFEGAEDILTQYYKKVLTSIYRMRNNTAALLLRNNCSCIESDENLGIMINGIICHVPKQALKNILQKEYDAILKKNITDAIKDVAKVNSYIAPSEKELVLPVETNIDIQNKDFEQKAIGNCQNLKLDMLHLKENQKKITNSKKVEQNRGNCLKTEEINLFDDSLFDENTLKIETQNHLPLKESSAFNIPDLSHVNESEFDSYPESVADKDTTIHLTQLKKSSPNVMKDDNELLTESDLSFFSMDPIQEGTLNEEPFNKNVDADTKLANEINIPFLKKDESEQLELRKTQTEMIKDSNELEIKPTIATEPFRPNVFLFDVKEANKKEDTKEISKPKFLVETSSDDPDDIIKQLKKSRKEYDKQQVEQKISDGQNAPNSFDTVFDLSNGSVKSGVLDSKEAVNKIDRVADSLIKASRKDNLIDTSLNENIYKMQSESDYKRNMTTFILDKYTLKINIYDNDSNLIREEIAKLVVAPITIPESGSKFVTDICAYLESAQESYGAIVSPGGKTTIAIKCDDYSVFIRGSWENGLFVSTISAIGNGSKISCEIERYEMMPLNMEGVGIGHNVLLLDHATTVHVIPLEFENTNSSNTKFMCIVIKDYGIDQDAECLLSREEGDVLVKGEKFKYSISCAWDDDKNLAVSQRVVK